MIGADVPESLFRASQLRHVEVEATPELEEYVATLGRRWSLDDVRAYLDGARSLNVVVIGEAIIDEYEYCEAIGKSGKEPIVAARYLSRDRFPGGVLAVGNQLAVACDRVTVFTCLGAEDSYEEFIRAHLRPPVTLSPVLMADTSTIVKRRFVETYPIQKLFELYLMDGSEGSVAERDEFRQGLERLLADADLAVIADYGHGLLREEEVALIAQSDCFLAVNTQMNADNRGFNTISKYPRADFVCLSENEIRLEARSRHRQLREIVEEVGERLGCRQLIVTRGRHGCACFDAERGYSEIPGFTTAIVDRVGAGDAMLSLTALLAVQRAPIELMALFGNAVGAAAVGVVGNSGPIEVDEVIHELTSLLA
jgi:bifunctional ADP-heptose synthase (sugar kinase/adenylyltransferase)